MVDLVLLRHGRTEWNAVRRIQGHSDSRLDPVGHAQAEAVAPEIAALSPAALWSSDSVRARDTADYVAQQCGLVPRYDARLREYALGPREGLLHHEYAADHPAEYAEFVRANFDAVPGAEKSFEVARRMAEALAELAGLLPPEGVGVAVSHGAAIRAAIATMVRWLPGQEHSLRGMDNCGWAVLRRPAPGDPWRLVAYNRTARLAEGPVEAEPRFGPDGSVG